MEARCDLLQQLGGAALINYKKQRIWEMFLFIISDASVVLVSLGFSQLLWHVLVIRQQPGRQSATPSLSGLHSVSFSTIFTFLGPCLVWACL